jgi:glutathione S-transferase
MKLYDYQLAPNPRRVRIFLAEKGIAIPTVRVDLRDGEQFTPEFRSTGSIPTESHRAHGCATVIVASLLPGG